MGADSVLKSQTPPEIFLACPSNLRCAPPQFRGHSGGIPQWKTDIVKITRVKNNFKALLTWRLADVHDDTLNTSFAEYLAFSLIF